MAESQLKKRLTEAMKDAMRSRDKARLGTVRLALAEIKKIEVDERIDPDDTRVLSLLDKMIKQRRDSVKQFVSGNREDLAAIERAEILVLQEFMPAELSYEELQAIVRAAVASSGTTGVHDMGKVMAVVKPQVAGRADMGAVNKMIKAQLVVS
jgi:uncharacterized protein